MYKFNFCVIMMGKEVKYNQESEKIYDTIDFFIEYFDKNTTDGGFLKSGKIRDS